jgi:2-oxoglutarate ferredoxin oxidoreductase subunit beta
MAHATGMKYLKQDALPHMWCAGCGNGVVLGALARAFEELDLAPEDIVAVTGIGCWGKADDYLAVNALHTTHGRALAYATGVKAANPKLHVVALMGDGDGATIGGNHLIHSARRNMPLTAIIVNNYNYGMTGGQFSATTPANAFTSTSVGSNPERAFDICELARAAGANYVARETSAAGMKLKNRIKEALEAPGFSLVEAISPCTTQFGPKNNMRRPVDMFEWLKAKGLPASKYDKMVHPEQEGFFKTGVLVNRDAPDFITRYEAMRSRMQAGGRE